LKRNFGGCPVSKKGAIVETIVYLLMGVSIGCLFIPSPPMGERAGVRGN
jgi:hypothetical protein